MITAALYLNGQGALAQETFSFQGRLTTPDGTPVADGSYGVAFHLFDAPTGGNPLWGEGHVVTTTGGVFSVLLGTKTTLNLDAFHNTPQLQLTIEGTALSPRTPLTAVPLAMKSYRLDAGALRAGDNVSINRLGDGTLQIGAAGGGGTGGLTSVATDGTIAGNGTSSSPLSVADGSVTGRKLANGALVAGQNVTVTRQGNGSLEVSATGGGGGLSSVASDATLSGNGTAGTPLAVSVPLVLTGSANEGVVQIEHSNGNLSYLGGSTYGVHGISSNGVGVRGMSTSSYGVNGISTSNIGVRGISNSYFGIYGQSTSGDGIYGTSTSGFGIYGESNSNIGVRGQSNSNIGVRGTSPSDIGVSGESINSFGVYGSSSSSTGVVGISTSSNGIRGESDSGVGVSGFSPSGIGVRGSTVSGNAVYGVNGSRWGALGTETYAGSFNGNVTVTGTLSKSGGSFKIDHPLDPAGKYLSHSFVESPDMMNVYNGNVITDAAGEATITLPDYFEALNRDFRYQLTTIGGFAPVYIAEKISGNQFKIAGGIPGMEVSWQVTGIRQDAWAEAHRIVVEKDKPANEHGFYLHPKLFGQPERQGVGWGAEGEVSRDRESLRQQLDEQRPSFPRLDNRP